MAKCERRGCRHEAKVNVNGSHCSWSCVDEQIGEERERDAIVADLRRFARGLEGTRSGRDIADLAKLGKVYQYGSPQFCNHANEVPGYCPCAVDCYCWSPEGACSKGIPR